MYVFRLVAGDVEGKFEQLFTKVANIQKKSGQFDVRLYITLNLIFISTLSFYHVVSADVVVCGSILCCWR